jgi:DNA-binding GntR family transcriptional regulator
VTPTGPPAGGVTKIYESIRDQIANEIASGIYPAGALLPSIREIMQRWEVSTTTARRVLDELAAAGYARKEGTRGHISTGGSQPHTPPPSASPAFRPSPARQGRLTVRSAQTFPATGAVTDDGAHVAALDVRTELAPAEVALALRLSDPGRSVIVRRQLLADSAGTPVQLRTSYISTTLAESTSLAERQAISEPWVEALASHTGRNPRLGTSHITARHPHHDEAPALDLATDAAVLVREDIHCDDQGTPIDYTRTVWPGDTTRLVVSE